MNPNAPGTAQTPPAQQQTSPQGQARGAGQSAASGAAPPGTAGTGAPTPPPGPPLPPEFALAKEPLYEGEPILAVAADSEELAAEAIERIIVDFEQLPFVIDPLDSLRPGGPNGRTEGNVFVGAQAKTLKWTDADFEQIAAGKFPMNAEHAETQQLGDVDAALKASDLVLEETWFQQTTSHQPLESRSAMAYWQNGKLYLHGSTQSVAQTVPNIARWCGIPASRCRVHQRVHRRRVRQQDSRRRVDGDPGTDVEEAQWPSGDDAAVARRGNLHRPHAPGIPGGHPHGIPERWARDRDRRVHRRSERPVSASG